MARQTDMNGKAATSLWVVRSRPQPSADLRLFCFPYAGGGALIFHKWHEHLPPSVEVCAIQPPGRANRQRETPFQSLDVMVREIAGTILPYLDRPFAFFGHSMGALISFELARRLRREHGMEPVRLIVSARQAPQIIELKRPTYNLPEPEFMEELERLNGTPQELLRNPELMRLMIPLLRADFELIQTYVYGDELPLNCPITALGGLQDDDVSREQLQAWREQTTGSFTLRMFPGDHFFLHVAQPLLLNYISRELYQAAPFLRH